MKVRIKEISPNPYNRTIFEESLKADSIAELAENIRLRGLHYPIRVTKIGRVIIDGERRYLACKKLGWDTIEVIEQDVQRDDILDHLLEAASSQRQMSLLEQARVYHAYYKHLSKTRNRDTMSLLEAKKLAIKKAGLPFKSITLADQLIHVVNRGDPELHEKLLSGGASITSLYEKLERRTYGHVALDNPPAPIRLDVPYEKPQQTRTPEQKSTEKAREQARAFERAEEREEKQFTERYVETHQDELRAKDAQQKLLALYEPEPPPATKKFPETDETRVIKEALESLAVREPPEKLVARLTDYIEAIVLSVKGVDEQRARDVVREVVKPMVLRLSQAFPRHQFDLPVDS